MLSNDGRGIRPTKPDTGPFQKIALRHLTRLQSKVLSLESLESDKMTAL